MQGGANLIFLPDGLVPVREDPLVKRAWAGALQRRGGYAAGAVPCHGAEGSPSPECTPSVKGVQGRASPAARRLVSFNAPALSVLRAGAGLQRPRGRYAAFAYTTALNTLLADTQHCQVIGDTTVVCWAEHGGVRLSGRRHGRPVRAGGDRPDADTALLRRAERAGRGALGPQLERLASCSAASTFYVLGLAPNAGAHLGALFLLRGTFGVLTGQSAKALLRLISRYAAPPMTSATYFRLWQLVRRGGEPELAAAKRRRPMLAGDLLRAILDRRPYPAALLQRRVRCASGRIIR